MESDDGKMVSSFLKVAGVTETEGFVTRRFRQGEQSQDAEGSMGAEALGKQMGHATTAHDRNYLKQLPNIMRDMAAAAGHSTQKILLGGSKISARSSKQFQDLFWLVCPTGFRAQVQAWL